jgi:class 3 adenylate cyclase/tetratricopeptide (TPR) repeat protein
MRTAGHFDQDTIRAYLPAPLVDQWARCPDQQPVWGAWLSGSLMFCDISGFTAMSENLARLGKEGAELMAGVLNRFFERMIALAGGWGGAQMKFGGDAMLLLYSGEGHAERAAAAGLEMQAAMADFKHLVVGPDTYRLRMRIAIHSGRFFGASVGQPDGVLHYMLVGPDVNRTAEIEGAGDPGQVVLSAPAAAQMGHSCRLTPLKSGVSRVRSLEPPPRPARGEALAAPRDVLKRYLLPPLAAQLVGHHLPGLSGEHRRVTAVFINLLGISPMLEAHGEAQALTQADAYVKILVEVLDRHGGFLAGSDLAQEGDKLICLFGAPVSVEDGEASALRAVLELDRQLAAAGLALRHRVGISAGFVFAGEIGSSSRREYTVIGDSVNLAARLMAAASPGEILVSKPTIERAGSGFEVRRLKPLRVKGKAAPVAVFRLARAEPEPRRQLAGSESIPLVGREEELAALLRLAQDVSSHSRRRAAYICGDAGIGKSRLTAEVSARLEADGWQATWASCQMHTSRMPFAPWREPLRRLLGIASDDSPRVAAEKLGAAVARAAPEKAFIGSLVGGLLALPVEEDPSLASLEPANRRGLLTSLLIDLIVAAANERPLLLLFEDAHWADSSSMDLLAAILTHQESRLFAIVTSRIAQPAPFLVEAGEPAVIHLRELAPEASRSLIASAANLSGADLDRVIARAQGNPLFLHEIARSGVVSGESLPDNVNDVILARLDRLPQEEKAVLRLASVIGSTFSLEALRALAAGSLNSHAIAQALQELQALGFTRSDTAESSSLFFSHVLTREVAYETLPYAQRRQLHRRAAHYIEGREAALEAVCELLLHHYQLAEDAPKVVRFAAMSGDRAAAVFAADQAMEYYNLSLVTLAGLSGGFERDRSLLLERLGDCLDTAGRHGDAAGMFINSLNEWRAGRHRSRLVDAAPAPRPHEADLCRKVAVSYERRSDYDESLNWVNEAIRVLPTRPGITAAQVRSTKSLVLFRKGLYEQAISWGRMGLALARGRKDLRQQAYAHHVLSGSYRELGKLKQALYHDRSSARLYHELGDLPGLARANSNLGLSYQMLGVLDAARYHYEVALSADERIANVSHAAIVRNNIAEVLLVQGQLAEAEAHLNEVVDAHRKGIARTALAGLAEVNLSRCSLRRGDLTAAWRHVQRGLRLLKSVGAEGLHTEALLQRVELRLAEGDANRARRDVRRILKTVRELEAGVLEARAERLLGRAEAVLDDDEASRSHLRQSVLIARHAGAGYEEALALIEFGRVLLASPGSRGRAGQLLRRAASILSRMDAVIDLADIERLQTELLPAPDSR